MTTGIVAAFAAFMAFDYFFIDPLFTLLAHITGNRYQILAVALLAAVVFLGQIFGTWEEGSWVRQISFTILFLSAHLVFLSPLGHRHPRPIHRIVGEKARVQGAMASIVEWQALRMQEYRFAMLAGVAAFFEWFGIRRPVRHEPRPALAGDYDHAIHVDHPEAPSLLEGYLGSRIGARVTAAVAADEPRPTPASAAGLGPAHGLSQD